MHRLVGTFDLPLCPYSIISGTMYYIENIRLRSEKISGNNIENEEHHKSLLRYLGTLGTFSKLPMN